jgi:hypothetical protein
MPATTTTRAFKAPTRPPAPENSAPRTPRQSVAALVSSAVAAVLGILPHVLHHVGPFAGAALVAGTGGTLLFGAIGLIAAIPFLLRVHRRCQNWRVPAALLALFAGVFSISTRRLATDQREKPRDRARLACVRNITAVKYGPDGQ